MKPKPPYNIWVYHKANGKTSFGEYINGKNYVFLEGKCNQETAKILGRKIYTWRKDTKREIEFKGDKLDSNFLSFIERYIIKSSYEDRYPSP